MRFFTSPSSNPDDGRTPEQQRQAEIDRNTAIQRLAQQVIHNPDMRADVRQAARDTAVAAHTALTQLQGGKGG